ncbi:pentapeptide repeat-containing protein [Pseudodesulfovibrio sp. JC047]|uniref:pentapeptide repeat-containing protein n=1 Tax=Pseudodesulfovibrio sp. JC047 TaxID=2683199 RepID=UPI0013CF88B0|nr:pentapeptide repeat-containing protein [Pseudodesulfovibrio sp. JC047]
MANPEHLKILKQGVATWNKWREDNPEIKPDFEGEGLQGADLMEVNFMGANLMEASLRGANLEKADLRKANLKNADMGWGPLPSTKKLIIGSESSFPSQKKTQKKKSQTTNLKLANLKGADLRQVNLRDANLENAEIRGADLRGTDLNNAYVHNTKIDNTMLCLGISTQGSYGSQLFVRHVRDLDYIEETKEKYPWKYRIWKWTSNCGRSIGQWAAWSFVFACLFGVVFANYPVWSWLPDQLQSLLTVIAPKMSYSNPIMADGWFTPYYFSIVTFTTLGFGDVTPTNTAGQVWLALEVILGYIMLGGLITLFATKMVRQSG